MSGSLTQYFDFYELPTGRRLFALRQVAELCEAKGLTETAALARAALQHDVAVAKHEQAWLRSRNTKEGQRNEARVLDNELDRALGGLSTAIDASSHGLGDSPLGKKAQHLAQRLFPEGVGAITNQTYEGELGATNVILEALKSEHADAVRELGLSALVRRLEDLIPKFEVALRQESTRELSYDQLRDARQEGQEKLLQVVAVILGRFSSSNEQDISTRTELLAPIMSQNRRMKDSFARHRAATDVDPDTGEEQGPPGAES